MKDLRISFGRKLLYDLHAEAICLLYELSAEKNLCSLAIHEVKQVPVNELNAVTVINFSAFTAKQLKEAEADNKEITADRYRLVSHHATDFSCSSTSIQQGWVKVEVVPAKVELKTIDPIQCAKCGKIVERGDTYRWKGEDLCSSCWSE